MIEACIQEDMTEGDVADLFSDLGAAAQTLLVVRTPGDHSRCFVIPIVRELEYTSAIGRLGMPGIAGGSAGGSLLHTYAL